MYDLVGPDDWTDFSVFDLAHWKNGLAFKNIDFSDHGRPIIKIAELKSGVSQQTARTMADYDPSVFIQAGDMLFSWSGNPDTSIDVFRWKGEDGWLNQHIFKVRASKGLSEGFLFFLLKWLKPRFAEIARNKQTTGLGHVTIQDLKRMRVAVPDECEQKKIFQLIDPLQQKIDLNRRMNETLDAVARAIFKDWFVDFGPTRAKIDGDAPYLAPEVWSLFPDQLDEEGKPEGWNERRVDDILELAYGKALKANERILGPIPVYGSGGITGYHNEALVEGPSIVVGRKGSVGTLYWEDRSFFPIDTVFYVKPKAPLTFCYYHLQTLGLEAMNTDAAVPGLNRSNVYRLSVPWSQANLRDQFDQLIAPVRQRMRANAQESEKLTTTRDLLLPKLMSGQVRIKDAEQYVAEAT